MNKVELRRQLAIRAQVSEIAASQFIDAFSASVEEILMRGERITIPGLGTFGVRARKAWTGVNPKTRERIQIPATTYPYFHASKNLKQVLR